MDEQLHAPTSTMVSVPVKAGLEELSDSDLKLLRDAALSQIKETDRDLEILLLGGVWRQMEQELRRRQRDILALERMYFAN